MELSYKGLPLHYTLTGKGAPLILLHGFNEHAAVWDLLIPGLSEHHTCVLVDLPGFGRSALPGHLSIPYMADAVHRIAVELRLEQPVVIGHSMGGYVTLELIHKHPGFYAGAGLFHSTAFADTPEKKENRTKTISFLNHNPAEAFFEVFIPGLFAPFHKDPGAVSFAKKMVYTTSRESVIAALEAMMERADRTEVLKTSGIPWLFVAGEHDQLLAVEPTALQSSWCEKSLFRMLHHSGHLGMVEEPEASLETILQFTAWVRQEHPADTI